MLSNIILSGLVFAFLSGVLIVFLSSSRSRAVSTARKITEAMGKFRLAVDNASSHSLIRLGGNVWFNSVENFGSTFYMTIPLRGMPRKAGEKQLTASVPNTLFY